MISKKKQNKTTKQNSLSFRGRGGRDTRYKSIKVATTIINSTQKMHHAFRVQKYEYVHIYIDRERERESII